MSAHSPPTSRLTAHPLLPGLRQCPDCGCYSFEDEHHDELPTGAGKSGYLASLANIICRMERDRDWLDRFEAVADDEAALWALAAEWVEAHPHLDVGVTVEDLTGR